MKKLKVPERITWDAHIDEGKMMHEIRNLFEKTWKPIDPTFEFYRVNNGKTGGRARANVYTPGLSDWILTRSAGDDKFAAALEIKGDGGNPSEMQSKFIRAMHGARCYGNVIYPHKTHAYLQNFNEWMEWFMRLGGNK